MLLLLIALLQGGGEGGGGEGAARWSVDLEEAVGGSRRRLEVEAAAGTPTKCCGRAGSSPWQ